MCCIRSVTQSRGQTTFVAKARSFSSDCSNPTPPALPPLLIIWSFVCLLLCTMEKCIWLHVYIYNNFAALPPPAAARPKHDKLSWNAPLFNRTGLSFCSVFSSTYIWFHVHMFKYLLCTEAQRAKLTMSKAKSVFCEFVEPILCIMSLLEQR